MSTISRMSSKSINEAERSRRKECISRSFQESKSKGAETVEVDVEVSANCVGSAGTKIGGWGIGNSKAFSESSSQCENYAGSQSAFASAGVTQTDIVSFGVLPYENKKDWLDAVLKEPSSVNAVLKEIVELFTPHNLNHIPLDPSNPDGEKLDADLLREFHHVSMERYCDIMLGEPCPVAKSCAIWNDCKGI